VDVLCKGFPDEFSIYLNYCRSLRFEDRPDYLYVKRLFRDLYFRLYTEWDLLFDWVALNSTGIPAISNKIPDKGLDDKNKKKEILDGKNNLEEEKKIDISNERPKSGVSGLPGGFDVSKGGLFKQKPEMNRPQIADTENKNNQIMSNNNLSSDKDGPDKVNKIKIPELPKNVKA